MSGVAEQFLTLVAASWMPWLLSGLIVIVAVLLWLDFRRRVARLRRALDEAIATLAEVDGQVAFKRRFSAVFQNLAENLWLGDAWRAYAPTLTAAPGAEDSIGYTLRPKEVFHEGLAAAGGIDLRFFAAVPNMLVGVGLLFSFLGLVAALHFASAGVVAQDVKGAQAALGELLAAATFKFATSIAGLGASLIFSWREKAHLYQLHWRIQHFCALLEARMVPVTQESLLAQQLAETRQVGLQLRRLSKSVYVRVPEALEDTLAAELRAATQPLHRAIAQAAERLAGWTPEMPRELDAVPAAAPVTAPVTAPGADRTSSSPPPASPPPAPSAEAMPAEHAGAPGDDISSAPLASSSTEEPRTRELRQLLDRRLADVLDLLQRGLALIEGPRRRSLRRRHEELRDLMQTTHDRLRDARSALAALAEHGQPSGDLGETLADLDAGLRQAREQIHEAAQALAAR